MNSARATVQLTTRLAWVAAICIALNLSGCTSEVKQVDDEPSGALLYAAVSGAAEVIVADADSLEILDSIPVGAGPAIILATPGTKKLFTANWADESVSIIQTSNRQVKTLPMGGRPYVIAMAPDGKYVYAGVNPSGVAVINTETEEIERTLPTEELAASLIVSPDGKTLYVATLGLFVTPGEIHAISTETGEQVQPSITVGSAPAWITIHPNGSKVYALNFTSDDISVVDTATWTVETTISTGAGSGAIIANVSPDGSHLWVTNHGTNELVAIDTRTYEISKSVALTGHPVGINFNVDGSRVYTTDFGVMSQNAPSDLTYLLSGIYSATYPGQLRAFDTVSGAPTANAVEVGPGPTSIVISAPPAADESSPAN